jgi:hypothetical protein
VSLWILDGAATASDWVRVSLYFSGTGTPINQSLPALPVVAGGKQHNWAEPCFHWILPDISHRLASEEHR